MVSLTRFFFLLVIAAWAGCHRPVASGLATVSRADQPQYVLFISLDGFRWDYVERFRPPNISAFAAEGVRADYMLASFPSKTFPNHYTLATGMYPDRHGLVNNSFYDPRMDAEYKIYDRSKVEDGRWYGGTPIWVHAMRAGMTTASYYFVGSEAPIQGMTPTYYHKYDGSVPNAERVHQALEWLALPEADRPRLIAMYFSDMDDVGHRHSPLADEVLAPRLMALDSILGVLFDGIAATGLPVNIVLVSDHGMTPIPVQQLLPIELLEDDDRYRTVNTGALAHFYLHPDEDINQVLSAIRRAGKHYDVFLTRDVPYFDIPPTNDRWGDLIAIPHEGHYFVNARTMAMRQRGPAVIGEHGFDPGMRDMHTIFYAKGPALRSNLTIPPFQNIHVFPLLCRILQLDIPEDIDGRAEVLEGVLRR